MDSLYGADRQHGVTSGGGSVTVVTPSGEFITVVTPSGGSVTVVTPSGEFVTMVHIYYLYMKQQSSSFYERKFVLKRVNSDCEL